MRSLWSDAEANTIIARYGEKGVTPDLALRVYTTRLLGGDPALVLHGGGNTSVKTQAKDLLGDAVDVICVKGSGWDMGDIEPPGLPAVKLAPLRRLRALPRLSDEDMVNFQRIHLLDSAAPNPSVETLLHAFLPHKFVDHTHSTAVLALTDQPEGEQIARETFGSRMAYVPYTIPGFALAKSVAEIYDQNRDVQGLILLRHGIFTFAEDARTAYELMIEMATLAEGRIQRGKKSIAPAKLPPKLAAVDEIAPILRGAVTLENNPKEGTAKRQILCFRSGADISDYVNGAELARYSQVGVATPDHTIRTKNWPLIVPAPEVEKLEAWTASVRQAVDGFVARYHTYFARNNQRVNGIKKELDPYPRVILVPGVGLFGLGASAKDAAIAADIAENTIDVVSAAEAMSRYDRSRGRSVRRRILVIGTGQAREGRREASGAPGRPDHWRRFGDRRRNGHSDGEAGRRGGRSGPRRVGGKIRGQTDRQRRARSRLRCDGCGLPAPRIRRGRTKIRWRGHCGFQRGRCLAGPHWRCRRRTVAPILRAQFLRASERRAERRAHHEGPRHGRVSVVQHLQTSGEPRQGFRAYGLPKAATLFLVKQYALDHGKDGIRANAVNADRIRTGLLTGDMVAARAKARGLSEADYMSGNLLGREVTADDVAQAFVFLALAKKTTAATITVDGGNIEASLR